MRDNQALPFKAGLSQPVTCPEVKTLKGFYQIAIAPRWNGQDELQLAPILIGDVCQVVDICAKLLLALLRSDDLATVTAYAAATGDW
jgi:hypothetical protein